MTNYTDLPQPHDWLHVLYHNHMAGYTDLPTRHGHYADLPQPHDGLYGLTTTT